MTKAIIALTICLYKVFTICPFKKNKSTNSNKKSTNNTLSHKTAFVNKP